MTTPDGSQSEMPAEDPVAPGASAFMSRATREGGISRTARPDKDWVDPKKPAFRNSDQGYLRDGGKIPIGWHDYADPTLDEMCIIGTQGEVTRAKLSSFLTNTGEKFYFCVTGCGYPNKTALMADKPPKKHKDNLEAVEAATLTLSEPFAQTIQRVQQDVVHKRDVCGYTCDDFFGAAWQYMYRMESLAKGKGLYIQYVMTKDNTLNMMNQLDAGVKVSGVELAKAAAYSDVLKKSGTGQNMVTKQLAAHCRLQTGKNAQKALMNGPGGGTEPEATDIVGMVLDKTMRKSLKEVDLTDRQKEKAIRELRAAAMWLENGEGDDVCRHSNDKEVSNKVSAKMPFGAQPSSSHASSDAPLGSGRSSRSASAYSSGRTGEKMNARSFSVAEKQAAAGAKPTPRDKSATKDESKSSTHSWMKPASTGGGSASGGDNKNSTNEPASPDAKKKEAELSAATPGTKAHLLEVELMKKQIAFQKAKAEATAKRASEEQNKTPAGTPSAHSPPPEDAGEKNAPSQQSIAGQPVLSKEEKRKQKLEEARLERERKAEEKKAEKERKDAEKAAEKERKEREKLEKEAQKQAAKEAKEAALKAKKDEARTKEEEALALMQKLEKEQAEKAAAAAEQQKQVEDESGEEVTAEKSAVRTRNQRLQQGDPLQQPTRPPGDIQIVCEKTGAVIIDPEEAQAGVDVDRFKQQILRYKMQKQGLANKKHLKNTAGATSSKDLNVESQSAAGVACSEPAAGGSAQDLPEGVVAMEVDDEGNAVEVLEPFDAAAAGEAIEAAQDKDESWEPHAKRVKQEQHEFSDDQKKEKSDSESSLSDQELVLKKKPKAG